MIILQPYNWLWQSDIDAAYAKFVSTKPPPAIEDYERELMRFGEASTACRLRGLTR
jgi:hypothetical protein